MGTLTILFLHTEARGDVAIHGLWKRGQTCILDIRVTGTDAKSYSASSSAKLLEKAAKLKRDKYAKACNERRRSFTFELHILCYWLENN